MVARRECLVCFGKKYKDDVLRTTERLISWEEFIIPCAIYNFTMYLCERDTCVSERPAEDRNHPVYLGLSIEKQSRFQYNMYSRVTYRYNALCERNEYINEI